MSTQKAKRPTTRGIRQTLTAAGYPQKGYGQSGHHVSSHLDGLSVFVSAQEGHGAPEIHDLDRCGMVDGYERALKDAGWKVARTGFLLIINAEVSRGD